VDGYVWIQNDTTDLKAGFFDFLQADKMASDGEQTHARLIVPMFMHVCVYDYLFMFVQYT